MRVINTLLLLVSLALDPTSSAQANDLFEVSESNDTPSDLSLIGVGLVMGAADFFIGTAIHEGGHAFMVEALGGDVIEYRPYPGYTDHGVFHFGWTGWEGDFTRNEAVVILVAPKAIDLTLLAGYTTLFEAGWMPENRYARLAIVIAATGALVDFGKDILQTKATSDEQRIFDLLGVSDGEETALRIAQAVVSAAAAVEVGRGYASVFRGEAGRTKRKAVKAVLLPNFIGLNGLF